MKAKFLKIAGVKSEKEFYKKYPTETAFFKAHPEAKKQIKKAQVGSYIGGELDESPGYQSYASYENNVPLRIVGKTQEKLQQEEDRRRAIEVAKLQAQEAGGGQQDQQGMGMDKLMDLFKNMKFKGSKFGDIAGGGGTNIPNVSTPGVGDFGTGVEVSSFAKRGKQVKKAQMGAESLFSGEAEPEKPSFFEQATKGVPILGDIIGAAGALKAAKKQRKELEKAKELSNLARKASDTQPERKARRYVRPEDAVVSPNERFIPGGTGTEILAQYGASVGGNPTEIQNTYNPGDLYSDLGYEPLSESDVIKQYRSGGHIPQAAGGFSSFMSGGGGDALTNVINSGFSQGSAGGAAGSQIGGAIGKGLGLIPGVGPLAQPILSLVGGGIGALADIKGHKKEMRDKDTIKRNTQAMAMQDSIKGAVSNYSSFVRNGGDVPYAEDGWVSHTWQPQLITHFGEHSMKKLLAPDETMDTLRTGGNMRQNNMSEMDQFNFGGSLKTHWGGRAEVDSYNPYLPGTGETVMFKGNQHSESDGTGKTGIGVSYGPQEHDSYTDYAEYGTEQGADVEVENGEPAAQLPDGEGGLAMTVYGALKINENAADEIGDPDAKGLTYKKYVDGINKKENKANKNVDKANRELEDLKVVTSADRLRFNTLQTMLQGEDRKLQDYAMKKTSAASVQNAYNETAEEYGLDADALAKGKIKQSKDMDKAKYGKAIKQAQNGTTSGAPGTGRPTGSASSSSSSSGKKKSSSKKKTGKKSTPPNLTLQKIDIKPREWAKEELDKSSKRIEEEIKSGRAKQKLDRNINAARAEIERKRLAEQAARDKKVQDALDFTKGLTSQIANLVRRPLQEDLDPSQLVPEMLAKAQNQLEPVQAQTFQPLLDTPFDASFQDQLNENQASFNAIQRQVGANPAALAALAAQKYSADSKVLADQFRTNQALRAGVFSKNRDTLNEASIRNLGILDQQYVRQQEAISKTRATDLEIAKSISDKIAKNKLENRTFAAYANLFPQFGFDENMMAMVQNPTFFQTPVVGALAGNQLLTQSPANKKKKKKEEEEDDDAKFGKRLKKQLTNGSIVKSLRNI